MAQRLYRRLAESALAAALADTPVVLIHGPRQSGKTTLAQQVGRRRGFRYYTFDDAATLAAARADVTGFVARLERRAILDEVQHVPELFAALKPTVDANRASVRLILTGSSNVLLVPRLSDSLAGRIEILRLYPLAQIELERAPPAFLNALFSDRQIFPPGRTLGKEIAERIVCGGYPVVQKRTAKRRDDWHANYIETLVQRDVHELAHIAHLDALPKLLTLAASQTARLANLSQLACSLLRCGAAELYDQRALLGQLLETFVFGEIVKQAAAHPERIALHHLRDKDGYEVDIVVQRGAQHVGIEVKAASSVHEADFRGIKRLRELLGPRFHGGIVLYDGDHVLPFGERLLAVPLSALWSRIPRGPPT